MRKRFDNCLNAAESTRLGGQRHMQRSVLHLHPLTSSQFAPMAKPSAVCPFLLATSFALLKEGSTQAWKNAKSSSERKHRSETGDSHHTLHHTVSDHSWIRIPRIKQLERRQDFKTSLQSIQISRKRQICFTLPYFFVKASWSKLDVVPSTYYLTSVPALFIAFQGT